MPFVIPPPSSRRRLASLAFAGFVAACAAPTPGPSAQETPAAEPPAPATMARLPVGGGSGTCWIRGGEAQPCSVTDRTDGSGLALISEIVPDGASFPAFLVFQLQGDAISVNEAVPDGEGPEFEGRMVAVEDRLCLRESGGADVVCVRVEAPPFADVSCRNDGPALPRSGLCADSATKWLDFPGPAFMPTYEPPPGCDWRVQETMFGEDEMMLYLAAHCDGKTTRLGLNGGARSAELAYIPDESILDGFAPVLATIISSDPADPWWNLADWSQPEEPQGYACEAKRAEMEGWPGDAIIVDRPGAQPSEDGSRMDCGRFGYMEDATSFWRIVGPWAVHFDLGQDAWQLAEPGSFTYMRRNALGEWSRWENGAPADSDGTTPQPE